MMSDVKIRKIIFSTGGDVGDELERLRVKDECLTYETLGTKELKELRRLTD